MNNIKQKFTKLIISFCFLVSLSSCEVFNREKHNEKKPPENLIDIAILIPLSGKNETIGKQYSELIKMGLGDGAKTKLRVSVYDSSDEDKLENSINKIIEKNTKIIIGPLYSKTTKTLSSKIKEKGENILVLSLSNDPTLADQNILIFGHAPMKQMQRVTDYLMGNDYKNYIMLLPDVRHSRTVSEIIQNMILSKGAILNDIYFYNNTNDSIQKIISSISMTVDRLNEYDENLKRPVIIVAGNQKNLGKIYALAGSVNFDKKVIFVGDSRIDVGENENFYLIYTGSSILTSSKLKQRASSLGVNNFSFMHAVAYDAGKIVASNISDGYNKNKFLANLHDLKYFQGASGEVYFIDSLAQRKYDIIKKHGGTYNILEKSGVE